MIARRTPLALFFAVVLVVWRPVCAVDVVNESAREIPLADDVDVVVVGGGTGAVAAAVAAAAAGARVFVAAPHPYLGDDMTATLQLWLEQGEVPKTPLAQQLFQDEARGFPEASRLRLTYAADTPSAGTHQDTSPPSRLTDGIWARPSEDSVQFERNTTIVADLGSSQEVRGVRVTAFRRRQDAAGDPGFDIRRVTVSASDDARTWRQVGVLENDGPFHDVTVLSSRFAQRARFVRFAVEIPESHQRMLLGELEVFGPDGGSITDAPPPRPLHVKKTLDDALLRAGVKYLYSCYPTDILHDDAGHPCGIVMANRAGRQAVVAKTVIDATPSARVARMAGARFREYPAGTHTFKRVVIGGQPKLIESAGARIAAPPFQGMHADPAQAATSVFQVIEYTIPLRVEDDSYAAYMKVDHLARTQTYDPQQQFTSDVLFEIRPDAMHGREPAAGPWHGADQLPLGAFRPADVERYFVLGGCADVSRELAAQLLRPLALLEVGARIGTAAAAEAKSLPRPSGVRLRGHAAEDALAAGEVRELLAGVRPMHPYPTVPQDRRALPVLGQYDVVVVGGGTGGAPAGIGAARRGAKTLVVEYLHGLGGVGTQGAIASYYWGNCVGFTATVLDGAKKWSIEPKMEWYRQELLKAGAEVWFGTIGCGAVVKDQRVIGAVVATPYGRGVVLAQTVIDATGNSDIAAAAGAKCVYTDAAEFGMQGTGLPGRRLGGAYNNTDFTIVDETDMVDIWHVLVYSKSKYADAFDHGRLIDTRERRRIVGDFTITMADEINGRTYPDSIERAWSNFDTHGYTIDPYFLLEHPEEVGIGVNIPIRAMLPDGLEGMIVTGLSISAHRDALPLIRMQADIQNGGYAAGVAAAMAAAAGVPIRHIDVRQLQRHLVEIGNLPASVLEDEDSYPLPDEKIAAAVAGLKEGRGAAVILAHPDRALPLLKAAFQAASAADRLAYAKALAVLGSDEGLDVLTAEVRRAEQWDEGWNYRGMGQFGTALSPLDCLIIDLGHAGNRQAVPVILEKVHLLDQRSAFSHHRAVGLALELLGDETAAQPLAELLAKPNMSGHVHADLATAKERGVAGGTNAEQTRRESLRELMLARALYRCGDYRGVGAKILRDYTRDLRGHLARHAQAVLDEGK